MQLPNVYTQDINKKAIDMTLSINPLGCAPAVARALKSLTMADVSTYPNTENLIQTIAKKFAIPKKSILLGSGSEQLIKLIAQTFLKPGDVVLVPRGSFFLFTKESRLMGARVQFVELPTLLKRSFQKPKLVFIANPGTPTGESIDATMLEALISKLSPAIIVIDEANGEFSKLSFVSRAILTKNCIVLRTFSKALGLAGLRVAFAAGPQGLITKLQVVQQPFPVSSLSTRLATAALGDDVFIAKTLSFIATERLFLTKELQALGLSVSDSVTNNLFIETPNAARIIRELSTRDVSVINGTFFPGMRKSGFRISIKDRKTNLLFLKKLKATLACMKDRKLLRSKKAI